MEHARKMADNMKTCSAACCSHQRDVYGPRIGERKRIASMDMRLEE
jgi:hypothetical protein